MKNIKSYVLGILTGVLLTSIPTIANQIYNIYENEYPIKVNGTTVNIQGYNINDYSYFKLRDIGEQVGFDVDFKEEVILITTKNAEQIENADNSTVTNSSNMVVLKPSDFRYTNINGTEYISSTDAGVEFPTLKWNLTFPHYQGTQSETCHLIKMEPDIFFGEEVASYEIPCVFIDDIPYLTREVFENEVLARINEE